MFRRFLHDDLILHGARFEENPSIIDCTTLLAILRTILESASLIIKLPLAVEFTRAMEHLCVFWEITE